MSESDDDDKRYVAAALDFDSADAEGKDLADYLARGRKFENETTDALKSRMVALYRLHATDLGGEAWLGGGAGFKLIGDLESEFSLRGIEFDGSLVLPELDVIEAFNRSILAGMSVEDLAEMATDLMERYKAARERMA